MTDEIQRIGVDFDGTLVRWTGRRFVDYEPDKIGEPIPEMVDRVRQWLMQGHDVVIFTARVHPSYLLGAEIARCAIEEWCQNIFGVILEVTCQKDPKMRQIWDDIAISVEKDTGRILTEGIEETRVDDGSDSLGSLIPE